MMRATAAPDVPGARERQGEQTSARHHDHRRPAAHGAVPSHGNRPESWFAKMDGNRAQLLFMVEATPRLGPSPRPRAHHHRLLLRGMVIAVAVIDKVKNLDASTDVNNSIEDVNDFLVMASAAAVVNSLNLSSAEIADREIKT